MEPTKDTASPNHGLEDLFRSAHLFSDIIASFKHPTHSDTIFASKLKDLEALESKARKLRLEILQPNPRTTRRALVKHLEAVERYALRQKRILQITGSMVDVLAKTSCRRICNAVQGQLPRELRDMVYEYLFEFKTVPVDDDDHRGVKRRYPDSYHSKWTCLCKTCEEYSCSNPRDGKQDAGRWGVPFHVRDADWTGVVFLDELAERWYETRECFVFHNAAKISSFLACDRLGSCVEPAGLIQNAEILVRLDGLWDIPEDDSGRWAVNRVHPAFLFSYQTKDITQGLRDLCHLTSTCRITIRILDGLDYEQDCYAYRKAVGQVFDELVALAHKGFDVTIVPSLQDQTTLVFRGVDLDDANSVDNWMRKVYK